MKKLFIVKISLVGILTAAGVEGDTIEGKMAHIKRELEGTLNTAQVRDL